MHKTLAIDPKAINSPLDCEKIYPRVGLRHGVFVADYPKRWHKAFLSILETLEPAEWGFWNEERLKSKLIELVEQESFLSLESPYDKGKSWFDNFLRVPERNREGCIFFGHRDDPSKPPTLDDLDPAQLEVKTTITGKLTPENLVHELRLYIRRSTKIALVDRHNYLTDALGKESIFVRFLKHLVKAVEGSKCQEIIVYAKYRNDHNYMKSDSCLSNQLASSLAGFVTPTYGVKYVCCSEDGSRKTDLHARRIVTNQVVFALSDSIGGGSRSKSITRVPDLEFLEENLRAWIDEDHGLRVERVAVYKNQIKASI